MRERVEDRWLSPEGETFQLIGWPAKVPTRTTILIHHGLGEHGGRYDTFARELVDLPAHLWTYDARGHGRSVGKRGDAAGLEAFAHDLRQLLGVLVERSAAERVLVFGHSMGAAVVGHALTHGGLPDLVTGVILSAPPVQVDKTLAIRLKLGLGRLLSRISPSLALSNEVDSDYISSVPAEVQRYLADPLVHDRLSVRLGLSLVDDGPRIIANAGRIGLPALLYQGLDDGIVSIEGTRALSRAWGHDDVQMHEFEGLRHECHHEHPEGVRQVFEMLNRWISPRLLE